MSFYIYSEIFVDRCYDINLTKKQPFIFDVGANTGFFALRMKQLYPNSKIICFEPYPPCLDQLNETIMMNHLTDVEVKDYAIADQSGKSKLYIHPTNIAGHSIFAENVSNNYIEIEQYSLADVVKSVGENVKCDLMKLDCEGAEYPIIKSMDTQISNYFEHIIYEPTYDTYDIDELNNHLKSLSYTMEKQQSLYHACKFADSNEK